MKVLCMMLALPVALAAQTPADTTAHPISLADAVALAQRNSPSTVQSRGQMRNADASVKGAYAAFIPSLNVSLSRSYQSNSGSGRIENGQIVGTPSNWNSGMGLGASVTLFDGGKRLFDIRTAKANVGAASANDVSQRFDVALNVKQAYFNALAARESEAAADAQLKEAQQQLSVSIAQVTKRVATKSDSLRSVIAVGNAKLALLTAQNNLRSANAQLTRLVATPYTVTPGEADTLELGALAVDSTQLLQLAFQGPGVKAAQASLVAAHASSRSARTPYLPSLSVSFQRNGNGPDMQYGLGAPFRYNTSWSFGLSYPLFNQLQREQSVVRADVTENNAEATLRDAKLAAEQQLTQYLGALQTAQERINIQTVSVTAGEEDLRVQEQRYAVGASTLLDVLTSQTALNQARAALIQARLDYRVAKAQIEALVGRDL
ncbi:MAG TPA: TolC family protein [Gemmatimonadaceae bacterium]|nr:TolC family protein [Gemmatimonadaceae bacterium]